VCAISSLKSSHSLSHLLMSSCQIQKQVIQEKSGGIVGEEGECGDDVMRLLELE